VGEALLSLSHLDVTSQLAYAVQLGLGVVFLLSALPKLRDRKTFARIVARYRLLPRRLARPFALAVIATEAFLAAAFLTGWLLPIALPLAAAVLVLFAAAVALSLRRGRRIPCGCFGGEDESVSARSLARLGTLLAAVVVVATVGPTGVTVTALVREGAPALRYLVGVGGVVAFLFLASLWLLSLPELASLRRGGSR
jgi:Methylamine utilisation protein MauE